MKFMDKKEKERDVGIHIGNVKAVLTFGRYTPKRFHMILLYLSNLILLPFRVIFGVKTNWPSEESKKEKKFSWKRIKPVSFYLHPNEESAPHINVSGVTGYGKSTLINVIIEGIISNTDTRVVCLDFHDDFVDTMGKGERRIYSAREVELNLWKLNGKKPKEATTETVEMFTQILGLDYIQAHFLEEVIKTAYERCGISPDDPTTWDSWSKAPPTLEDIVNVCESLMEGAGDREDKRDFIALYHNLHSFLTSGVCTSKAIIPFLEVIQTNAVVTLKELGSEHAKSAFVELFLYKLYRHMQHQGITKGVRQYVVIDEVQKVCASGLEDKSSYLSKLCAEGRKYGFGVITASQTPEGVYKTVVENSPILFAFYQREPRLQSYVAEFISSGHAEYQVVIRDTLKKLEVSECLCITSLNKDPLLIEVEHMPGKQELPEGQKPTVVGPKRPF